MPYFTTEAEIDIDPSEFVDSCTAKDVKRLVEILEEDGHIEPSQTNRANGNGVRTPNFNDVTFWNSLNQLAKCRDLLTIDEEKFINNLANKFRHLR